MTLAKGPDQLGSYFHQIVTKVCAAISGSQKGHVISVDVFIHAISCELKSVRLGKILSEI